MFKDKDICTSAYLRDYRLQCSIFLSYTCGCTSNSLQYNTGTRKSIIQSTPQVWALVSFADGIVAATFKFGRALFGLYFTAQVSTKYRMRRHPRTFFRLDRLPIYVKLNNVNPKIFSGWTSNFALTTCRSHNPSACLKLKAYGGKKKNGQIEHLDHCASEANRARDYHDVTLP
jgi:hypothetical protein